LTTCSVLTHFVDFYINFTLRQWTGRVERAHIISFSGRLRAAAGGGRAGRREQGQLPPLPSRWRRPCLRQSVLQLGSGDRKYSVADVERLTTERMWCNKKYSVQCWSLIYVGVFKGCESLHRHVYVPVVGMHMTYACSVCMHARPFTCATAESRFRPQ